MFDVVISHHVIEHVENQEQHLSELKRVLGANGTGYLACPNGGSPFMVGHVGNDQVPNLQRILTLIKNLGFQFEDYYPRLLKEPKKYHCETMLGQYLPTFALNATRRWHPGHCFLLTH
jgi:2-polyprenyl-3-methyl-5-hydroxy-6-metoxy-1,4-benzoquinol methylase